MTITTTDVETPVGTLRIAVRRLEHQPGEVVVACCFTDHWDRMTAPVRRRLPDERWEEGSSEAARALGRYLAGELDAVDDLVVDAGGSEFQAAVWDALRRIPTGETRSYADVAGAVGRPTATRAVGSANGRNPIWVIVPCHRVVRADGALGGYGGGVDRKQWLLDHERSAGARAS